MILHDCHSFSIMIRAAISDPGVVVIPEMFIEDELKSGQLITPFGNPIRSLCGYFLITTAIIMQLQKVKSFNSWIDTIQDLTD